VEKGKASSVWKSGRSGGEEEKEEVDGRRRGDGGDPSLDGKAAKAARGDGAAKLA